MVIGQEIKPYAMYVLEIRDILSSGVPVYTYSNCSNS